MHTISSKYRKPKGRPSKRRAAFIRNLEKGKSSACSSSSDSKCDEVSTEVVPSSFTQEHQFRGAIGSMLAFVVEHAHSPRISTIYQARDDFLINALNLKLMVMKFG
ncbi:hypothetical protein TNCT_229301 [Trichonephila clavata]|uniref:Uncharacterized protein n=1 Tax=Trichonephila clavata TaxID=2740835 RepID=A0A8X6LPB6_TRICU|nr:hypothetical protein TNCT_229301 [Trichonephila clavata]